MSMVPADDMPQHRQPQMQMQVITQAQPQMVQAQVMATQPAVATATNVQPVPVVATATVRPHCPLRSSLLPAQLLTVRARAAGCPYCKALIVMQSVKGV